VVLLLPIACFVARGQFVEKELVTLYAAGYNHYSLLGTRPFSRGGRDLRLGWGPMNIARADTVFTASQIQDMLLAMAREVAQRHPQADGLALVGVRTGGAFLSRRLLNVLGQIKGPAAQHGVIDITLYRDDWTRLHSRPKVGKTEIEFSLDDKVVILVDDVLFTGRTVRAAMDALIDFGRPCRIELAVLIDRGHRELPIQPDYVGARLETTRQEVIDVLLTESGDAGDAVVKRESD
jgi:pyrimidine operon attenuation protein/uracil phosphoribosyltransferase